MKNILNKMKQLNKKTYLLIGILLVVIFMLLINSKTIINRIRENFEKEELIEFEYETYEVSGNIGYTVVTVRNKEGIEKITYLEEDTNEPLEIRLKGKTSISFDYMMEDRKTYEVQAEFSNGDKKTYDIYYEIPRIKGEYILDGGIYVNKPDVTTGFVKEKTRYMYLNDEGNLIPGNWLTGEEPTDWYNYNQSNWANIYVEDNGLDSYWVWIPRYCYKVDTENSVTGNERMDVKFINTYNEYFDVATGDIITWDELSAQGYEIPEAFGWDEGSVGGFATIIPGYWMAKYQMTDVDGYVIDYLLNASASSINVKTITTSTTDTIAKYTYAINGVIDYESLAADDYSFTNTGLEKYVVNVTALNENGEIIGSMTKEIIETEVNPPDLTGFNPEVTYYVYYDENDNELIGNKISGEKPANWYNYTYSSWANIVITDGDIVDGKIENETYANYFVWIPRYAYSLDQLSERSSIVFLEGTSTTAPFGYEIPEAFSWGDNLEHQLTGYWMGKYQLSD